MTDTHLRDLLSDAADDRGRASLSGVSLATRARGVRRRRRAVLAGVVGATAAAVVAVTLVVVPRGSPSPPVVVGTDRPSPTGSPSPASPSTGTGDADRAALLAAIAAGGGATVFPYATMRELLAATGDPPAPFRTVVVGRVLQVVPAYGYVQDGPDANGVTRATPTDFDDPDADFWTLDVTVAVDETLVGGNGPSIFFEWPLLRRFDQGVDTTAAVARAIEDLGRILVVLEARRGWETDGGSSTPCFEPYCVAQVDAAGRLDLVLSGGAAGGRPSDEFLDGLDTVDEVRAAVG